MTIRASLFSFCFILMRISCIMQLQMNYLTVDAGIIWNFAFTYYMDLVGIEPSILLSFPFVSFVFSHPVPFDFFYITTMASV